MLYCVISAWWRVDRWAITESGRETVSKESVGQGRKSILLSKHPNSKGGYGVCRPNPVRGRNTADQGGKDAECRM